MAASLIHAQFGAYRLMELLGQGGFAEVYKAEHASGGAPVAVKVLQEARCTEKRHIQALHKEYEILAALDHASIPSVKREGAVKDRPAFIMEYCEGPRLRELAEEQARFDMVGAFAGLVSVTAYLHKQGIVHNDLKLENVILRPNGRIALVDFGNANTVDELKRGLLARIFKRKKAIQGTLSYIAPEVIQGAPPSPSSDVYALGVCAHYLFSNSAPFDTNTNTTQRLRITVKEAAPSIKEKVATLPDYLITVIDSCLAKDPDERPEHAGRLRAMLKSHFRSGDHMVPKQLAAQIHKERETERLTRKGR